MTRNEFLYELSDSQLAVFDSQEVRSLIALRQQLFTYVRAEDNAYLISLAQMFDGHLVGASLFLLKDKADVLQAHIDLNIRSPQTSRQCSMNFIVDERVVAEFYTDNEPIVVENEVYAGSYALRYFDLSKNTLLFAHEITRPVLMTTNVPHLGYSVPAGGQLVSLGFRASYEEMRSWLETKLGT